MKNTVLTLTLAAVTIGMTACQYEQRFAGSVYGKELESMVHTCIQMQQDGRLPGIAAGGRNLQFSSGGVNFDERDAVSYPLRVTCIVDDGGRRSEFAMERAAAGAEWTLAP
ncbi:MAG: hypothetical protein OXU31_06925 [Gammaproteobacteria bacterium]|nr:hypothetical protein [Gammaproteobacteria bacterium]MDD9815687.1 hypothetical protein [Gammaproteobacteria bacterium]MDD9851499.1 hypothetical protein [Gammaproteobacteria bacterium]MDD9869981.1 hypothetical protein [Gammaproteobacteria bacterium]